MRRALIVLLLMALGACGADKSTSPAAAVAGTYALVSVNGSNLPALFMEDADEKDEVTEGSLSLLSGGHFTVDLTVLVTDKADNTAIAIGLAANGLYTMSGSSITLTSPAAGALLTGTVSGDKLTVAGNVLGAPTTMVFNRE